MGSDPPHGMLHCLPCVWRTILCGGAGPALREGIARGRVSFSVGFIILTGGGPLPSAGANRGCRTLTLRRRSDGTRQESL